MFVYELSGLWVWIPLRSLKLQMSRLFRSRNSLTFRQLQSVDSLWNRYVTIVKGQMEYNVWNRVINIPIKLRKKSLKKLFTIFTFAWNGKSFAIVILVFFFSFSFSSLFLDRLAKDFKWFLSVFLVDMCDQVRESIIGHTGMPWALEINISDRFKHFSANPTK